VYCCLKACGRLKDEASSYPFGSLCIEFRVRVRIVGGVASTSYLAGGFLLLKVPQSTV
jgi:hypothetical protein